MEKRDYPHYEGGNPASLEESESESENDFSAAVLGYINQVLMEEEDMEDNYSTVFHDSLALQHAEKSFYDVIGHNYPPSPPPPPPPSSSIQHHLHNYPIVETPDQSLSASFSDYSFSSGSNTSSFSTATNVELADPTELCKYNPLLLLPTTCTIPPPNPNFVSHSTYFTTANSGLGLDYPLQFERGVVEQGTNFLPKHTPFVIDPDTHNTAFFPSFTNAPPPHAVIKIESDDEDDQFLTAVSQGRKNWEQEDEAAGVQDVYVQDDIELSELFDKLLLLGTKLEKGSLPNTSIQQSGKRQSNNYVDLRTLLMICAQAISSNDTSTANQLLNQINQHSSPFGDATQRLAHFFKNALQARLTGTGSHIYRALSSKKNNSAADMVRAYQVYTSASPFEKLAVIFANNTIWNLASNEAETLHIIDFGVGYGFKWPAFIHRISKRVGGPPKLRITGIDLPKSLQKVHETGRRLASYCNRFNVPFEYNAIAKRWENIAVEDLKIRKNEFVAVNCLFRFENLLDESVVSENPRDAVLGLIKKANPNVFVHCIVNGGYDAPFFVTRFREALYHYSALFDMLDDNNNNIGREDPMRLMFEEEFWGREVMNVLACEGCERVERPETYKQWQIRHMRSGFRSMSLDQRVINKIRGRLRDDGYSSDFMVEVDGNWMLQGWKGRILYASSCWVPQ